MEELLVKNRKRISSKSIKEKINFENRILSYYTRLSNTVAFSFGKRYCIVPITDDFAGCKVVLPIPAPSFTTAIYGIS